MPILLYTSWQDSFREMTVIHTRHGIFVPIMYMIHGMTGPNEGIFFDVGVLIQLLLAGESIFFRTIGLHIKIQDKEFF